MDTFADRVTLLQSESARIKQYLHALPPDAWERPSACTQWQVRDVVAHLAGVAEFYASSVTRGIQGDYSPPPGRPPAGTGSAMAGSESLARRTIAARERLGDQLLVAYDAADDQLNRLLAGLRPQDREKPCYHPGGIVPAQNFIDLRLKELAMHEWDMRSRLEPDAHLSSASLPAIMTTISDSIASGSIPWAFWPGARLSAPVCYRFAVTGLSPRQTDIIVEGDTMRLAAASETPAQATFRCDTEAYVLLMYGRLNLEAAIAAGRVVVEGDRELATAFSRWFKGI
jgi:uncharacterized protein (TIGR03083 family)